MTTIRQSFFAMIMLIATLLFCGCQSEDDNKLHYFAFRWTSEGKWGMMSTDGEALFEDLFSSIPEELPGTHCFAVCNDSTGLLDIYTLENVPEKITGGYSQIGKYGDGLLPVVEKNGWVKYINTKGEEKINLKEVDGILVEKAGSFHEGRARFWIDGKCGFIDKLGNVIAPAQFEFAEDFNEEKAVVFINKKWGFINKDGSWLVKPIYDYAQSYQDGMALAFKGGACVVENGWFFDECSDVYYNYEPDSLSLWSAIDDSGEALFVMADTICYPSWGRYNNCILVYKDGKKCYVDAKGRVNMVCEEDEAKDVDILLEESQKNKGDKIIHHLDDNYVDSRYRGFLESDSLFYLVNEKGDKLSKAFAHHGSCFFPPFSTANVLASEYVDIEKMVDNLQISDHGIGNFKIGMAKRQTNDSTIYMSVRRWGPLGDPYSSLSVRCECVYKFPEYNDCCGILQSFRVRNQEEQVAIYNLMSKKLDALFVEEKNEDNRIDAKLYAWFGNEYYYEDLSNISLKSCKFYKAKGNRLNIVLFSGTKSRYYRGREIMEDMVNTCIYNQNEFNRYIREHTVVMARSQDDLSETNPAIGTFDAVTTELEIR